MSSAELRKLSLQQTREAFQRREGTAAALKFKMRAQTSTQLRQLAMTPAEQLHQCV